MKTKLCLFTACLLMSTVCGFARSKTIKGNGRVVSKNIPISAYDAVSIVGNIEFEYEQSQAAPSLELTIDENLIPYLEIKVEGRQLKIAPKQQGEDDNWETNVQLNPTVYLVKSNSSALKEVNSAGSGSFTVVSPLKIDRMEINKAGSGSVVFQKRVTGYKAKMNLAGSGEIHAKELAVDQLECNLAGSGEVYLKGAVPRADFSVASSGEIHAFDCKVDKADCSVAGSGEIEVYAVDRLDASVVGSGGISYRGNPSLSKSVMGSGSVEKK